MTTLVNLSDVPLEERQHARAGLFRARALLHGEDHSLDNFYLQLSHTYSDFHSPRHRHNFDQVRLQITGDADFARDGVMKPGHVGYFPEGAFYGPQSISGESATLVLQFGGASKSGYISEQRFQEGVEQLKKVGHFENGIFHRDTGEEGRRHQDAYEAVWEHLHARRLEYPKSAVDHPVFWDPQAFAWQDQAGEPGTQRKLLGVVAAGKTRIGMLKLAAGAQTAIAAHSLLFVLDGSGRLGGRAWEKHATMRTTEEAATLVATAPAQLLELHITPHSLP